VSGSSPIQASMDQTTSLDPASAAVVVEHAGNWQCFRHSKWDVNLPMMDINAPAALVREWQSARAEAPFTDGRRSRQKSC
jgi:hypothetical protein